jgi:heme/copper-type cytochrome/quinol oxidase subunit 2
MDFLPILSLVPFVLALFVLVCWLWALIDILRGEFSGINKIIWLLLVIFIPILGMILYFAIGRKQKIIPGTHSDKTPIQ